MEIVTIKQLQQEAHRIARVKGFYNDSRVNFGEKIALIHSEVSEALEAHRKKNMNKDPGQILRVNTLKSKEMFMESFKLNIKDTINDELADIVIRVFDLAEFQGIDLEAHIVGKMRYNSSREYQHGKRY